VAGGGADDVVHQLVEVGDPDVALGGVDELEILGEEPPGEVHPQAHLHGRRQLDVLHRELVVAVERLADVRQRGALVLDGLDEEPGLVVLDPLLDARDDLALAEALRRDLERIVGELEEVLHALAPEGRVVLGAGVVPGEVGGEAAEQLDRLLDAVPAEVVQHAPRDAHQQLLVGLAQELDDDEPLALVG